MKGFAQILRKELAEIAHTWRIFVFPGIMAFFAISDPILQRYTKELLGALASGQMGDLSSVIPDPTHVQAYGGYINNLSQIGLITLMIITGGLINGEVRQGTAQLVLTKPVSRGGFLLGKFAGQTLLVTAVTVAGAFIVWLMTSILFPTSPPGPLFAASAVWLLFGILILAVTTGFSALFQSQAAAAGAAVGVWVAVSVLSVWGWAAKYTFAGLTGASIQLASGNSAELAWPIATGVVAIVAVLWVSVAVLRHKELA